MLKSLLVRSLAVGFLVLSPGAVAQSHHAPPSTTCTGADYTLTLNLMGVIGVIPKDGPVVDPQAKASSVTLLLPRGDNLPSGLDLGVDPHHAFIRTRVKHLTTTAPKDVEDLPVLLSLGTESFAPHHSTGPSKVTYKISLETGTLPSDVTLERFDLVPVLMSLDNMGAATKAPASALKAGDPEVLAATMLLDQGETLSAVEPSGHVWEWFDGTRNMANAQTFELAKHVRATRCGKGSKANLALTWTHNSTQHSMNIELIPRDGKIELDLVNMRGTDVAAGWENVAHKRGTHGEIQHVRLYHLLSSKSAPQLWYPRSFSTLRSGRPFCTLAQLTEP